MDRLTQYRIFVRVAELGGFTRAADSLGLPKASASAAVRRLEAALGAQLFEELLATRRDIDAVFFCNDDLAQGGLLAAHRLRIPVPGRVAIAGFNDLAGSDQMLPPLTTVHTPRVEVGEAGARMLLQLMRGEKPSPSCVKLPYRVVVRQST